MEKNKFYTLPKLNYGYGDLSPIISEEQLRLHYEKHHQAYVNAANKILERFDNVGNEDTPDIKGMLKELSFHVGGHILHSLFWQNLLPKGAGGGGDPEEPLKSALNNNFGSYEIFKKKFFQAALSTEGSGWAALALCPLTNRLILSQIEKHNLNIYPDFKILLVLDVWEHAYYLDYKNERAKFIESFWNIVNWSEVNRRFQKTVGG